MPEPYSKNCLVIGTTTLAIGCMESLLRQNFTIVAAVSDDPRIQIWARENNIVCMTTIAELNCQIDNLCVDFLFSIVNEYILPEKILSAAKNLCINYHDSPLPLFAGNYATSWALIYGQTEHAVSWHLMADRVDAGDILKQQPVSIAADDTALTLNIKCYEAALMAFDRLLDDINNHKLSPQKQDLSQRTFFRKSLRPDNGAALVFSQPAKAIIDVYRGLQFGNYTNELSLPKLFIRDEYFIITQLCALDNASSNSPGTLIQWIDESAIITTQTTDIRIGSISRLNGEPVNVQTIFSQKNILPGYVFDTRINKELDAAYQSISLHEKYWVDCCKQYLPAQIPFSQPVSDAFEKNSRHNSYALHQFTPSKITNTRLSDIPAEDLICACLLMYLDRINTQESAGILISDARMYSSSFNFYNFFANAVPLTATLDKQSSTLDVIKQLTQQILTLRQHKTFARDMLLRYPDVDFSALQSRSIIVEFSDTVLTDNQFIEPPENSDIKLIVARNAQCCTWLYNTSVYDKNTIEKITGHFCNIISAVDNTLHNRAADIDFISAAERYTLTQEWNNTTINYAEESCAHELFEKQVRKNPDHIAVFFEGDELTYAELNQKSNQLAHYLRNERQVTPDTLVGICIERSLDMVVGILAILKAGAAYVPLDPEYPEARLAYMLEDATLTTVLTKHDSAEHQRTHLFTDAQALYLDCAELQQKLQTQPTTNLFTTQMPHHLAYIIYTSGSTGNPKGVMIEQRAFACHLQACCDAYNLNSELHLQERILQFASLNFDAAQEQIFSALVTGSTLYIRPTRLWSPREFFQYCDENAITVADLPPTYCLNVLSEINETDYLTAASTLKKMILGGEALNQKIIDIWKNSALPFSLFNAYGPTETVITPCVYQFEKNQRNDIISIGRAIAGRACYVLDDNNLIQPQGVAGELHITGTCLARGYLNRPDVTFEKFIPNPFHDKNNPNSSERLYKTGDLVRWLPDGNLEFLGRIDDQVKIRGFRIELGEIENALTVHEDVKDAVVLAKASTNDDKYLAAYVAVKNISAIQSTQFIDALRHYLQQQLPEYMVPATFFLLEDFPVTPNGKVDRKALPEPNFSHHQQEYIAPQTAIEKKLCHIWQSVLEIERVGITDNFYQLGGHSLKAIKLITKMQAAGMDILAKEFMQHPTVAGIADILNNRISEHHYQYTYKPGDHIFSPPNRQLLFKNAYHHHWNIDGILNIEHANSELLEQALHGVFNEHPGLRSVYHLNDGVVHESIIDTQTTQLLEIIDLSTVILPEERSKKVEEIARQKQSTLNLNNRLFRFVLFTFGPDVPAKFMWIIHHSIVDGYSIGIFVQELFIRYVSLLANMECKLPPRTTDVVEWGNHLHHLVNDDTAKKHIDYWTSLPWHKSAFLMDYPQGFQHNQSSDKSLYGKDFNVTRKLSAECTAILQNADWRYKEFTAGDIIFSTFAHTIARLTNTEYVNFEMAVSGRDKIINGVDLSRTIGWLVDDIPILVHMPENVSSYEKVKTYSRQYNELPVSGLSFNAFKHLSEDAEVREIFRAIPRAEFNINYASPAAANVHDQDIDHQYVSQLPLNLLSQATEYLGEPYNVIDIKMLWPSYIQINLIGNEFTFFWFTRDNIYKKETVEAAMNMWINDIEKTIHDFQDINNS